MKPPNATTIEPMCRILDIELKKGRGFFSPDQGWVKTFIPAQA